MSFNNVEHAFIRIVDHMKKNEIPNILLLFGVEDYLISWATKELVKKYVNEATKAMDVITFEEGSFNLEKVKEACETVTMFSERKIVLVKGFAPVWGKEGKLLSEEDKKEFINYLPKIPDSCLLIITAPQRPKEKAKWSTPLYKAIEEHGEIYDFQPLSEKDLKKFIIKRLKNAGKVANNNVINMFISESGYYNKDIDYALYNLENDIKKMVALSAGEEISQEDVIEGISDNLEHNIFKMLDAISNNRKEEAFNLLNQLMKNGASTFHLLAVIISQIELMLEVKELNDRGMSLGQIQKTLKVHEFRIKKAINFSRKFREDDLKKLLLNSFNVEKNIKTGLLTDALAMELLIAAI